MAFEYLDPLAAIWRTRGLRHILMPQDIGDHETERPPERSWQQKSPAAAQSRPAPKPTPANAQPENAPAATSVTWQPIPVKDWPAAWQERLDLSKKGRVAWTYRELGADLSAQASDSEQRRARSLFLRRVLADLRHPAGTHTFWPGQLAISSSLESDIFWSGLKALGCRGVIIMGPEYAATLAGKTMLRPYLRISHRGQFVWILPDINNFPESDYSRMLKSLRKSLEPLVRKN